MENYQKEANAATGHSCQQHQQKLKKNINVANKAEWKREGGGRDSTRGRISLVMHLTHEKLWPRYKWWWPWKAAPPQRQRRQPQRLSQLEIQMEMKMVNGKWSRQTQSQYTRATFHVGVATAAKLIFIVCPDGHNENSHAHSFKSIISISHHADPSLSPFFPLSLCLLVMLCFLLAFCMAERFLGTLCLACLI